MATRPAPSTRVPTTTSPNDEAEAALDSQTVALRVIAGLLIVGAAWLMADLLVPVAAALTVAVVLAPLAGRLERVGLPAGLSALVCLLLVVAAMAATGALLVYQGGHLVRDSGAYVDRAGELFSEASRRAGLDRLMPELGVVDGADGGTGGGSAAAGPAEWAGSLRGSLRSVGRWLLHGVGGLLGVLGQVVVFLAFLYYMLASRSDWDTRLRRVAARMGLGSSGRAMRGAQSQIRRYAACVSGVAVAVGALVTALCWALGLPTPLAWGVLAGLLEFVPYFGPLIAGGALAIVALATGGGWFEPTMVVVVYAALQTIEGYVISPLLYGGAVKLNPVTVLFGLLFFGWIWGPVGLLLSLPMMVLLRGLVEVSPETPALDALLEEPAG